MSHKLLKCVIDPQIENFVALNPFPSIFLLIRTKNVSMDKSCDFLLNNLKTRLPLVHINPKCNNNSNNNKALNRCLDTILWVCVLF